MKRLIRVLPWLAFALVIASWAPGLYYDPLSDELTRTSDLLWAVSFLAFPLVGLFLALRIPSNAVGWLFLIGPALVGAGVSSFEYAEAIDSASIVALSDNLFLLGLMCLVASIVVFPDGRHPNRWFLWIHVFALSGLAVSVAAVTEESPVTAAFFLGNLVLPVVSLVFRVVRGDAISRRQIAGPVLVTFVGLLTMAGVFSLISDDMDPSGWSRVIAFMVLTVGVPVSIALSITRYRLYEIDRIVARTVSYSLVVGLLVAVVAGVAALAGAQFDEPWVVAATTLAVAALFNPLRTRIQRLVDRRFNRSRYDTQRVVDEFAGSLRERVDAEEVVEGWIGVVDSTMQPASVGVWVRE